MADKYSTIQQHQPLRVPGSFDKQGRALIVQLDEIFDDIYRRFGRLRMEDLGKALVTEIKDKYGQVNGIYITEDGIDIISEAGEEHHIRLQSGSSVVLIDPENITMNTDGLVKIFGKDDSIIRLVGGSDDDQTVFQADAAGGVQAKDISSEKVTAAEVEVTNLKVTGVLDAAIPIPNIIVSSTEPSGHGIIWLEPTNGVITPFSYTESVNDAVTGDWTEVQENVQWTQTCNLGNAIAATGAKKLKISGKLYKNGSTAAWDGTLTAVANVSNGNVSTIDLGTVGTFPYQQSLKWDYGFSREITISDTITAGEIVSITFTFTISRTTDRYADLSYPHAMTVTCSGETGSGSSDECTVHYIA